MARKNFGKSVGTTQTTLLSTPISNTITIRTITVCNKLAPNSISDIVVDLWYIDSSESNTPFYILKGIVIPNSSSYTIDIGQVLEENDSLLAISDIANSADITGSYEI